MPTLYDGIILKRYKRFLADIQMPDGEIITAHCPNTGSMTGCWEAGAPVQLSHSDNPKRKLPFTLERVDMGQGWVGVNTHRVNKIIGHLLQHGAIDTLKEYPSIQAEPKYQAAGFPPSRFDFKLSDHANAADCYVEVKNTTLLEQDVITFPDAVSTRGAKHLRLLQHAKQAGQRAIMLYAINRPEGQHFQTAAHIDPNYANTFQEVINSGVEALAVRLKHQQQHVIFDGLIPIKMN